MPDRSDVGKKESQEIIKKLDGMEKLLVELKTQSGIQIGKILEQLELDKLVRDQAIKFYDDWFGEKCADFGFPR